MWKDGFYTTRAPNTSSSGREENPGSVAPQEPSQQINPPPFCISTLYLGSCSHPLHPWCFESRRPPRSSVPAVPVQSLLPVFNTSQPTKPPHPALSPLQIPLQLPHFLEPASPSQSQCHPPPSPAISSARHSAQHSSASSQLSAFRFYHIYLLKSLPAMSIGLWAALSREEGLQGGTPRESWLRGKFPAGIAVMPPMSQCTGLKKHTRNKKFHPQQLYKITHHHPVVANCNVPSSSTSEPSASSVVQLINSTATHLKIQTTTLQLLNFLLSLLFIVKPDLMMHICTVSISNTNISMYCGSNLLIEGLPGRLSEPLPTPALTQHSHEQVN